MLNNTREVVSDKFYSLNPGCYNWQGKFLDTLKLITEKQLYDVSLWKLFTNQFSRNSDDEDNGWRCEFWGKMMRGACLIYNATNDKKLYSILVDTVEDLIIEQDELGRIATYSVECEFHHWDMWGRKYVMLGLEYFYDICENGELKQKILNALILHADYIVSKVGRGENQIPINETSNNWSGLNSSSILEPFVRLYKMTGKQKYLDFSAYIVSEGGMSEEDIFERAYEGKLYPYEYAKTKAYEMMSCFEGLLEFYRVTGEEKWKTAVLNFIDLIAKSDITIIGSAGYTHELFDNSAKKQFLKNESGIMQETCVTVTWMKLCYQALCLTGESKYADYIEHSAFNAMLGCINTEGCPENGGLLFDSYSPIYMGKRGCGIGGFRILNDFKFYGCCVAIGAAGIGIMGLYPAMKTSDALVLNSYSSGIINTEKAKIEIKTNYPADGIIRISCLDGETKIKLRIPSYSDKNSLFLNDKAVVAQKGEYAEIVLSKGDEAVLIVDCSIRIIKPSFYGEDDKKVNMFALAAGPLTLARDSRFDDNIEAAISLPTEILPASVPFESFSAYELICDDQKIKVVDYASSGKNWNRDSLVTVWIPQKVKSL